MLLEVSGICKNYGNNKVLDNVNLSLDFGEVYGLLGENGAGKSTLISIITGLLKPNNGKVLFKKNNISLNLKEYHNSIGLVPQDISLFEDLTGIDNLKFWSKCYKLSSDKINDRITYLSNELDINDVLNKKIKNLSGGYKRRFNIAAALLHSPKILILDEPTVGIDVLARNKILEFIKKLSLNGTSIIYTSHYIDEIEKIADNIGVLHKGRMIENITKKEITLLSETYSEVVLKFNFITDEYINTLKNIESVIDLKVDNNLIVLNTNNKFRINDVLSLELSNFIINIDVKKNTLETIYLKLTEK